MTNDEIKHLQALEESRASDEAPSFSFKSPGFIPAEQICLAYRCPFCFELPYISKAYKNRVGDNRVVYCKTIGCALYKFAIVLRIWNTRTKLHHTNYLGEEKKEDIYARSYNNEEDDKPQDSRSFK